MNLEQAKGLLQKYRMGLCSEEEVRAIENWYESLEEKGDWSWNEAEKQAFNQSLIDAIHRSKAALDTDIAVVPIHKRLWLRLAVAASILFLVGMGTYEWFVHRSVKSASPSIAQVHDVAPGSNKAILTLADGSSIVLDSAGKGAVAEQGASRVVKLQPGQLSYEAADNKNAAAPIYNILTVPRGGKYALILPDGSKVWLNAASSLRYPVSFAGLKQREVSLTGEGYFEIKHLQSVPFIVHTRTTSIQDIGTRFNVMAYNDEPVEKTTLAEGAIKLTGINKAVTLQPGEQGKTDSSGVLKVAKVEIDQEMSWMHNEFNFYDADLYSVMRQISRWYNVEIVYRGNVPNRLLNGSASRDTKLSTVLHLLSVIHINGRLEGNTVIIEP